jgi:parallel beta-helix repeat protein
MKRFLLIAAFALCRTQVSAQTLYVPSGEYNTIQSAINDAIDGDTIVVSAGTYQENINFLGKAITVRSVDPNDPDMVAATIIDGSNPVDPNIGSVVTFNSGEDTNSVLSGFTITGGTGSWLPIAWHLHQVYWNRCGGGVVCYNMSEPTIIKNVFSNNIAGEGGGIYIYGDPVNPNHPSNPPVHVKPVITDNTFVNNSAIIAHGFDPPNEAYPATEHGDGGAIVGFQGVDAAITGNLIQNNHADSYGGGIHLRQWSKGKISDNEIIGNNSIIGAGIHITYTSSPLIAHNLIKSNTCTGGGGGIYVYFYSDPVIERNFIIQNTDWYSAGIGVYWSSEPRIRDNILIKNKGQAILCNTDGTTIVTGNTISDNYEYPKHPSGGIFCRAGSHQIIEHNIITSNAGGFGISADANTTARYNNIWGNGKGNYSAAIGDQTGINGNISAEPKFVAPDSNDYHLSFESPCINAGDPNFVPAPNETDYDGDQRLLGQYVDIGADEVVTNPADFNADGIVDYFDLKVMTDEWFSSGGELQSDLFDDDFIDFADYAVFAEQWLWTATWHQ